MRRRGMRRGVIARVLVIGLAVAASAHVMLMLITVKWSLSYLQPGGWVWIEATGGMYVVNVVTRAGPRGKSSGDGWRTLPATDFRLWPRARGPYKIMRGVSTATSVQHSIVLPLWLPSLLSAAAAAAIWRFSARAVSGICPWCAYSRAGLANDIACPECGRSPAILSRKPEAVGDRDV